MISRRVILLPLTGIRYVTTTSPNGRNSSTNNWGVLLPVCAALALAALWAMPRANRNPNSLVVYCAHDAVYADEILKDFEKQTGIHVDVRYDTEATKSLGLINLIQQERRQPRCDVFWNNEMLGTLELKSQGLLEPYTGSAWKRIPEKYRDDEGYWVGFASRLRVVIVNTREFTARIPVIAGTESPDAGSSIPTSILDGGAIQDVVTMETSKVAAAKPLFGTTLTHYTVLWDLWGPDRLKEWHHELRSRGLREVSGNGPVKDVVASGTCQIGLTDTDDVFVALDEKLPVDMFPVRLPPDIDPDEPVSAVNAIPVEAPLLRLSYVPVTGTGAQGGTICIPNTAAIIRKTQHIDAARKLIDYLASEEVELKLARSKSRQIPLGPVNDEELPTEVRRLKKWAADGIDLRPLLNARRECLQWLRSEYVR
ncbi:MAG: substrate-binding domain-containing protein [Planctomycetaceae bacterium]